MWSKRLPKWVLNPDFDTKYTDSYTIVVKFKKGLWTTIQNQIASLLVECSKDTDLTAWFEAIRYIDQAQ